MGIFDYGVNTKKVEELPNGTKIGYNAWSSNNINPKEVSIGTGRASITFSTGYEIITIPHGLGYQPTFKVYYDNDDGVWHELGSVTDYAGPLYEFAMAYTDNDNLYIHCTNGSGAPVTFNVRYFIYINPFA